MGAKFWGNHANTSNWYRPTTGSARRPLATEVDYMTNVKCDIITGGDKGIVAGLVMWVQMRAVLARDVLPWQLKTELSFPVMFPIGPKPRHLSCRQLPHVFLHPRLRKARGCPRIALHHNLTFTDCLFYHFDQFFLFAIN